jgi:hypothetical protein
MRKYAQAQAKRKPPEGNAGARHDDVVCQRKDSFDVVFCLRPSGTRVIPLFPRVTAFFLFYVHVGAIGREAVLREAFYVVPRHAEPQAENEMPAPRHHFPPCPHKRKCSELRKQVAENNEQVDSCSAMSSAERTKRRGSLSAVQ